MGAGACIGLEFMFYTRSYWMPTGAGGWCGVRATRRGWARGRGRGRGRGSGQGSTGQDRTAGRTRPAAQGRARQGSTGNTHRTRNVRYTGKGLELATEADAKGLGLRKMKMKKMRERTWKLATAALAGQTTSGCRPQGVGGYV